MKKLIALSIFVAMLYAQSVSEKLQQAKVLEERKDFENALSIYKEVLNSKELDKNKKFEVYLNIADIELDKFERPDSAIKYLQAARKDFTDAYRRMDEVFYRLGLAYEKLGDYQNAAEAYQTVAVRFQKSKYLPDALDGVERVFRKNFKEYVAFIGDEPITRLELEKELENIPPFARSQYETEEGKQKLLKNLIQKHLLVKEAENRKMYLSSSYQEEMKRAREQALIRALYQNISQNISVDDKEIKEYYEKNKDSKYRIPASVTFRAIIVNSKETADTVYRLLKKGIDFDSVFNKYNIDEQLKATSGLKKDVPENGKPQELVTAALKMKKGEISKPIRLEKENKYAVIRVEEEPKKASYRDLSEVKDEIRRNIQAEKTKKAWDSLIDSLWQKYNVKIVNETKQE
uniref:peptidylprolyl isomerase n=1 Tax=candidate division WOR-3 bacterium TaxID=2052148 RepID=A0A7V3KNV8_UNCW3